MFITRCALHTMHFRCPSDSHANIYTRTYTHILIYIRPLEHHCKLNFVKFASKEGEHTFWHSSAHILGMCVYCEMRSYSCSRYLIYTHSALTLSPSHTLSYVPIQTHTHTHTHSPHSLHYSRPSPGAPLSRSQAVHRPPHRRRRLLLRRVPGRGQCGSA
jgi:hypothetical protein